MVDAGAGEGAAIRGEGNAANVVEVAGECLELDGDKLKSRSAPFSAERPA